MNNFILSELARTWRARTERGDQATDGSDAAKLYEAEQKGSDKAYLDASDELEQLVKMFGGLE